MTLEESREVIPLMENMINRIEDQQELMAEMYQEMEQRDGQLNLFQEQNQRLQELNNELQEQLQILPSILDGRLKEYLHEIDEACYEMRDRLVEKMKEKQGVTEQLKAENQMMWVGKMNNIIACAEEVVVMEVVYVWSVKIIRC